MKYINFKTLNDYVFKKGLY